MLAIMSFRPKSHQTSINKTLQYLFLEHCFSVHSFSSGAKRATEASTWIAAMQNAKPTFNQTTLLATPQNH
ncbi:hypothetical protein HanXRQr2_Chr05g0216801 [Helianthus annuus]|uniref:Uncharacterized protein n=1 Tax=Helianthus annuus TaxID=4232 RepID=A0A9K3NMG6_HELAN|nr:hypothetical protein HanXRQr2_Chr05g0216801 [Helianthus annuus]KAJ0922908.1 hypothetical protein HanPSC8_Chr05g0209431 [Helianthus annuus]